jgi:hypothetical protein
VVSVREYPQVMRENAALMGYTPSEQARMAEEFADKLETFKDRCAFVDWLPAPEFLPGEQSWINPAIGNDLCWAIRPRGGAEPDLSDYYDFGGKWGRGHVVSHMLFNLKWSPEMYRAVMDDDAVRGRIEVAHLCVGRKFCVNPMHLRWEERAKNRADAARRRGELVREMGAVR